MKTILLTVAGYDPTSGAGVSLDLKVFQLMGFQGTGVLTSVTSQNTKTVNSIHCLPADLVWNQYKILCDDLPISGIKIGMVCNKNIMETIGKILDSNPNIPKVIDPVIKSSSGKWLFEKESVSLYMKHISGKASLITPNLEEARIISGIKINDRENLEKAAETIFSKLQFPCLIKGFYSQDHTLDLLYDGKSCQYIQKKIKEKKVHGTGCFYSSSILGYIAKGDNLEMACVNASNLIQNAITNALSFGQGQSLISFHSLKPEQFK